MMVFVYSFLLAQKGTQKGQPVTWPRILRGFPALLAKKGRHRKVVPLWGTPPSRLSFLDYAARRRETAKFN